MRYRIIEIKEDGQISYKIQLKRWFGWRTYGWNCGSFGRNEPEFNSLEEADKYALDTFIRSVRVVHVGDVKPLK